MFTAPSSLTVSNATSVLQQGLQAIAAGQTAMDFSSLTVVDSSAVATLLAWRRAAVQRSASLEFQQVPVNLLSLVTLYGVAHLLGLKPSEHVTLPGEHIAHR